MSLDRTETEELAQRLLVRYSKLRNWQAVADEFRVGEFEVPKIVVWRIANDGYEPQKNEIRRALGLSEIIIIRQKRDTKGRYMRKLSQGELK